MRYYLCPTTLFLLSTALLSAVQMIGMAIAPTFSAFLHDINFNIVGVHFDRLNSVGLILVIINLASQVVVYFFLPDLPTVEADDDDKVFLHGIAVYFYTSNMFFIYR